MNALDEIPLDVVTQVRARLGTVAGTHQLQILHAIESGSRAWGFASPDSDYDVRFVYVNPPAWYFSVHERRDVVETPIEEIAGTTFDVNGWDLRKALRLLAKSNPVLLEWLQSPIVYASTERFAPEMLELAQRIYSIRAAHYHYFNIARRNFREHLAGESIKLKKYFYVLRPVLACLWVEKGQGIPPMRLTELLDGVLPSGSLRDEILGLRDRKMQTPEFGEGAPIPVIHSFLETQLRRLASLAQPEPPRVNEEALDGFLRRWGRADRLGG